MIANPGLSFSVLCLAGVVLISGQVEPSFVPVRCSCLTVNQVITNRLSDFEVFKKGPHCKNDEIIVTLKSTEKGGQSPEKVCLSPEGHQGKRLLRCWNRAKSDKEKRKGCLQKRRHQGKNGKKQRAS